MARAASWHGCTAQECLRGEQGCERLERTRQKRLAGQCYVGGCRLPWLRGVAAADNLVDLYNGHQGRPRGAGGLASEAGRKALTVAPPPPPLPPPVPAAACRWSLRPGAACFLRNPLQTSSKAHGHKKNTCCQARNSMKRCRHHQPVSRPSPAGLHSSAAGRPLVRRPPAGRAARPAAPPVLPLPAARAWAGSWSAALEECR